MDSLGFGFVDLPPTHPGLHERAGSPKASHRTCVALAPACYSLCFFFVAFHMQLCVAILFHTSSIHHAVFHVPLHAFYIHSTCIFLPDAFGFHMPAVPHAFLVHARFNPARCSIAHVFEIHRPFP